MTGNIQQGIALLIAAVLLALFGLLLSGAGDLGGFLMLLAFGAAVIGLVKLLIGVLRPQAS